jgi:PTH1 family peptidyl-tRNA hydrolase
VGIGRPPLGVDPAEFVLTRFTDGEAAAVEDSLARAVEAVEMAVTAGIGAAMNRYNAKDTDGRG